METKSKLTHIGPPSLTHPRHNPKYESPTMRVRRLEHAIDMDEKEIELEQEENKRHWRSCCFDLDRDSTIFFARLFISTCVIGLCSYQLFTLQDCGSQHMYSGLLGIILGAYLK